MRLVFIGCVEFSWTALERVLELGPVVQLAGVATRSESSFNADFRSLTPLAAKAGVPCFLADGREQSEMAQWLASLRPEVIYCFGWSHLLRKDVLSIPPLGVVGYHPAALPKNRGRHPIIWSLVLGLKETASTFFFMDEGADSGDILDQRRVTIEDSDNAGSLYGKLTAVALEQIADFTPRLAAGRYTRKPQDHSRANYWRKRSRADGCIDWRMSARSICNLVRALAAPYQGAHCLAGGRELKIWRAELVEPDRDLSNIEYGKILAVEPPGFTVKCGEGTVRIIEHEFDVLPEVGDYL
ncbi:MAG: formyltransferase family protein [Candidatus Glassbacteria bacterium]